MDRERVPPYGNRSRRGSSQPVRRALGALCLLVAASCGGDSEQKPEAATTSPQAAGSPSGPASALPPGTPGNAPTILVPIQGMTPPSGSANAGTPASTPAAQPGSAPPAPGAGAPPALPPPAAMMPVAAPMMSPHMGPVDGDPSKPKVDVPGLKCGPLAGGFGAAPQTVKISNRDVVVAYPCANEGAAVTFFLFLHGTLQEAQKVSFTMNAFAIHKLIDSHNVIMALPKATGTQWGNGDNGVDLPHLYEVIDWVYATFGTKFSIRSMWAQGGSWGAAYLSRFACDEKLKDRLRGIQLIVGGGCPACSDRLSCVVGQQELEKGMNMMLTPEQREMFADRSNIAPYAMRHGCGMKSGPTMVGNVSYWEWPNCQKGWVHSYYMAPGQHADAWDAAAVLKMTEEMKSTEN